MLLQSSKPNRNISKLQNKRYVPNSYKFPCKNKNVIGFIHNQHVKLFNNNVSKIAELPFKIRFNDHSKDVKPKKAKLTRKLRVTLALNGLIELLLLKQILLQIKVLCHL